MVGSRGRSGGRNKKSAVRPGDGLPTSPRALSPRAQVLFSWLLDKIGADDPGSPWARIDGVVLASLAELMASQEQIASQLADDPSNIGLMRVRLQYAAQITRMSAVIGMAPADRKRLPQAEPAAKTSDPLEGILRRMSRN